ncbi:Re/Si-specific NAD(P)(+) transhydrogenase subunit alpha [Actinomycetaceae bacterium WB03_NA08]|uniref:proton-translocating NAD(P)(+) transhydrogenase n=1 Tax=Scrofimicrobium canadense TaxID=2652290 RepID=A0A6N7VRP1_9ACTO|nr:Re/Si-specific NAD(P)(+) transhydrogenase subunit alpha [Scrofimicrobium canadense]MSS84444.1 Re/Si-specific NAD(P)(+) transhydrogenase subunit alpha [Scrofimicrobium canadense]
MRIGVPLERPNQPLVAATPDTVRKLIKLGYEVCVEVGAGAKASFPDSHYEDAQAQLVDHEQVWKADVVLSLDAPSTRDLDVMREGATLIARLAPARHPELLDDLAQRKITALAMDTVPRISRAQAMDVLSSQANVAGNRAIIEAAHDFGRLFTGQVTAAGKMPPARVYVIGAGVAGLAAIGAASAMGAEVYASDVRPEVAEQVESMGARFVPLPGRTEVSKDGYARALTAEEAAAANALYAEQAAQADIVVTTANVPGRKSPILLDEAAIAAMKPGSVIVDMAAANGGNTTETKPGEKYVTPNGVLINGPLDLAGQLPAQSSQLYAQNIVNLLKLMTPQKNGDLVLDLDDEIVRGITVTTDGGILWPPPPVQVSAAPVQAPAETQDAPEEQNTGSKRLWWMGLAAVVLGALVMVTPTQAISHYMVLALAIIVGFYVITNVTHSLHTPLMSVTNAISGIILVGAILQIGSDNIWVTILSFIAIVVASINIFGGFRVTARMLSMFQKA